MSQPDFLPISIAAMVNRKEALSYDLFRDYWRDVHIVLGTRIRVSYLHRLHFLTFASPVIWANLEGIEVTCPIEDRFDGIAEVWYPSGDHIRGFSSNPLSKIIAEDEQNIFSRVIPYFTLAGNVRTYIDVLAECPLDGPQKFPTLIFCIQKVTTTSIQDFRTYMADQFAPVFAQSETALRVRLHLPEAYKALRQSPHVRYEHPEDKQYQAWMEVMFKNSSAMARFFDIFIHHAAIKDLSQYIRALHTYVESETYTYVNQGQPTLVGLRGYSAARAIMAVGARNEMQDDVLRIIYGDEAMRLKQRKEGAL
ncbi:MAG TPA: EthD domain-containing protein [Ktedonobacteraceae bacterium]|jgi:hypothetical protein